MLFDGGVDLGQDGGDVQESEDLEARLCRGVVVVDHGGPIAAPTAGFIRNRRRDGAVRLLLEFDCDRRDVAPAFRRVRAEGRARNPGGDGAAVVAPGFRIALRASGMTKN